MKMFLLFVELVHLCPMFCCIDEDVVPFFVELVHLYATFYCLDKDVVLFFWWVDSFLTTKFLQIYPMHPIFLVVSGSRFIIDHTMASTRSLNYESFTYSDFYLTSSMLGNDILSKRFAVQTLFWSL